MASVNRNSTCPRVLTRAGLCNVMAVNQPMEPRALVTPMNSANRRYCHSRCQGVDSVAFTHTPQISVCNSTILLSVNAAASSVSTLSDKAAVRKLSDAIANNAPAESPYTSAGLRQARLLLIRVFGLPIPAHPETRLPTLATRAWPVASRTATSRSGLFAALRFWPVLYQPRSY